MRVYVLWCRPVNSNYTDHDDKIEAIFSTNELAMKDYQECVKLYEGRSSYWIEEFYLDRNYED